MDMDMGGRGGEGERGEGEGGEEEEGERDIQGSMGIGDNYLL